MAFILILLKSLIILLKSKFLFDEKRFISGRDQKLILLANSINKRNISNNCTILYENH